MSSKFKKTVEDFVCEHCGKEVKGNGFTNHCPYCLWSKHVDVNPGDRAEACGGMMEPIDVIHETGEYRLVNRCVVCGYTKRNKMSVGDNFEIAAEIVRKKAEKMLGN